MPYPYPQLSGMNDSTNLYTIFKFVNTGVGGTFMPLILAAIWIVILIGAISEGRQASRAFIFASFICAILSILLALIGMLNTQYMYFLFLLVGIGVIWYKLDNAPGI
jgi:phosphoglycerol transferase MdoB-like AlkP superfamily enzyme